MFPLMQKLRRLGYDGRGVKPLRNEKNLESAFNEPSVLEKFVDFSKEISVIVSRNASGEVSHFPVVDLKFNPEANLVEFLHSPSELSKQVQDNAIEIAIETINKLQMVGILAVEMFVTKDNHILVNEIAPRPHNSGHQTIEGNRTSQYEQHLRALFDLPPGDTSIICPSVMVNLLGEKGFSGEAVYEGFGEVLEMKGTHIHLYGKKFTRPFRKMGHVTVTGDTLEEAVEKAEKVKQILKVKA
jgi:5-(carboxyamino)imidazole ribonucleotide synthase